MNTHRRTSRTLAYLTATAVLFTGGMAVALFTASTPTLPSSNALTFTIDNVWANEDPANLDLLCAQWNAHPEISYLYWSDAGVNTAGQRALAAEFDNRCSLEA